LFARLNERQIRLELASLLNLFGRPFAWFDMVTRVEGDPPVDIEAMV
jgi:hypothetical protein